MYLLRELMRAPAVGGIGACSWVGVIGWLHTACAHGNSAMITDTLLGSCDVSVCCVDLSAWQGSAGLQFRLAYMHWWPLQMALPWRGSAQQHSRQPIGLHSRSFAGRAGSLSHRMRARRSPTMGLRLRPSARSDQKAHRIVFHIELHAATREGRRSDPPGEWTTNCAGAFERHRYSRQLG